MTTASQNPSEPLSTLNPFICKIVTVAAMAGFLFGFDTGNIAGALLFIQHQLPASSMTSQSWIVSITVLGAFFGALVSGYWVEYFGRRVMLILSGILFLFGALAGSLAPELWILLAARGSLGLAIGISSYTAPLYIAELSPPAYRGRLVLLNGVAITCGEAIAYLTDYTLAPGEHWRWMIFLGVFPAVILLAGMHYLPTSPRWLIAHGQDQLAKKLLQKIRGSCNIEKEFQEIKMITQQPPLYFRNLLGQKNLRHPLLIGIGLGIFQQFFGINTIMYYGPHIFQIAGFQTHGQQILATFLMGLVNMLMTIVTGFSADRYGRRTLLLIGSLVAAGSLSIIALLFNHKGHWVNLGLLIFMTLYIVGYCMSVGSLFWLIIAEIFPLSVRSVAMSLATAVQWLANFIVSISFLPMLNYVGPSVTFSSFAVICILCFIFSYLMIPETRGVSLESIEHRWRKGIVSLAN